MKAKNKPVKKTEKSDITEHTWEVFREAGMLWLINTFLHVFGWSIVMSFNSKGKVIRAYPARVTYRGFAEHVVTRGHQRVAAYLKKNSNTLLKETKQ